MDLRFYQCEICGKIIAVLSGDYVPTLCCGEVMRKLIANHTDGAFEKHVPVYQCDGSTVNVRIGSQPHPMTENHSITWIGLRTLQGFQMKDLNPGDLPEARFELAPGDRAEAAYAFCNLHGLWISETETEAGQ